MRAINIFYAYSCIHIHGASVCQMKRMCDFISFVVFMAGPHIIP